MVSQPGLVVGVLVSAAALASAGFLLVSATALGDSEPLFYLLASSGAVWKVAGLAVALTLVVIIAILASFFLVVAAQSLRYIVQDPFPSCRTGISQALLHGGSSLLCVSLLALLETCCWARRRAG